MSVVAPAPDTNAVNDALTKGAIELDNEAGDGGTKKDEVGSMVDKLVKEFAALEPIGDDLDPTSALQSAAFVLSMACHEDPETFDATISVTPCDQSLENENCTNHRNRWSSSRGESERGFTWRGAADEWHCGYFSPSLIHPGGYFATAALSCFTSPCKTVPNAGVRIQQSAPWTAEKPKNECNMDNTPNLQFHDGETVESLGVTEIPIVPEKTEDATTL